MYVQYPPYIWAKLSLPLLESPLAKTQMKTLVMTNLKIELISWNGILQKGKINQMLYLEAEMEFRAHIWSFDSTHECFHSWEYERLTPSELRVILDFRNPRFFLPKKNLSDSGDELDL